MGHSLRRFDVLQAGLTEHANDIGYIAVTAVLPLDDMPGNRSRHVLRLPWTYTSLEQRGVAVTSEEPSTWASPVVEHIASQLTQDATQPGTCRYRISAYMPGGNARLVDVTVYVDVDDEHQDTSVAPPRTPGDILEQRSVHQVEQLLDLTMECARGAVEITRSTSQDLVHFLREDNKRLHERNAELMVLIGAKDRQIETLTRRVVDREREVLERSLAKIDAEREELEDKVENSNTMDRLERIVGTALEVGQLSKGARELLPLLKQDDVVNALSNPKLRAAMSDPKSRRDIFDFLQTTLADPGDAPEEEP